MKVNRQTNMEKDIEILRKRILPILLFCQANKGDLINWKTWRDNDDAGKKFFYAYYSGLFCRILYKLEEPTDISRSFVHECNDLLDKYNWYDIQDKDIKLCQADGTYGCEVPEALEFLDGIDNVAWKDSGFGNGRDAVCLKMEHGSWTFADVRGGIK